MIDLLGMYRPGRTLVHRVPAGPKLGLLAAWSLTVVVVTGWRSAVAFLLASLALALYVRLPAGRTLRAMRGLLIMLAVVAAYQVWQRDWQTAVTVVCDLLALFVASLVFTFTTPADEVLTAVVRGLGPFRRFGVHPERVGLAFSLMLNALPTIFVIAQETRAAAKARGLERSPRALLVPLAIRTVAHAYATGDALHARGIGDD